jgi:hypothetical protein
MKVLVETPQHAREVGLLDPYPHVLIGLQPRCYLAQETLARLNARLSGYVDVSAQRFDQQTLEAIPEHRPGCITMPDVANPRPATRQGDQNVRY